MSIHQIRLYDLFRKELHLPDDKAAAFVLAVKDVTELGADAKIQLLATKSDVHFLKNDIHVLKSDIHVLKDDIHLLKDDIYVLKGDIHQLEIKMEQSKGDIYKAMFLTGIVQLMAILGGVTALLKLFK